VSMRWSSIWRPGRELPEPHEAPPSAPGRPASPGTHAALPGSPGADVAGLPAPGSPGADVVVPGPGSPGVDVAGLPGPGLPPDPNLLLLAVCDPRIPAELRDLRERVPGVEAVLVASVDGAVLAHDPGVGDRHAAGRIGLALLVQGGQATVALGRGRFRNCVIWGSDGYLAVYAVGQAALLLVQAGEQANVGRLHYEARTSVAAIAALLRPA